MWLRTKDLQHQWSGIFTFFSDFVQNQLLNIRVYFRFGLCLVFGLCDKLPTLKSYFITAPTQANQSSFIILP